MCRVSALAGLLVIFAGAVSAQSGAWAQCGGVEWSGSTTCVSGYTCTFNNEYYSQCIPTPTSTSSKTTTQFPTSPSFPTSTESSSSSGTTTSTAPAPTGSQIRSDDDPTYHFYLQDIGGEPVLGPEVSSGYFIIGSTIALNNANGTKLFLNIDQSGTASYKGLTLDATATTTDWALEGDTIITSSPRELNFLACATSDPTVYSVYLQEGNDTPSGQTCSMTSLHLPCLC
ncbi:hypothetical protein BC834DRAFT_822803 [Gloeopeniophorella convolvens]|nr:hypothetical protein BC834DRAFT_822803 [Gloeopeniophorella convolvens]